MEKGIWVVRDSQTKQVLSIGATLSNAINNYEAALMNAEIEKELGYNSEDMLF